MIWREEAGQRQPTSLKETEGLGGGAGEAAGGRMATQTSSRLSSLRAGSVVLVIDTDLEGDLEQVTALHWGPSVERLQPLELMALQGGWRGSGRGRTSSQDRLPQ